MTEWIVAYSVLAVTVLGVGVLALGMLRRLIPVVERSQEVLAAVARTMTVGGLPIGTAIPSFKVRDVRGNWITTNDLRGSPAVILFIDSSCDACDTLLAELRQGGDQIEDSHLMIVVSDRRDAAGLSNTAGVTVVVDEERSLAGAFRSVVIPHAFSIDEHGIVLASGTPNDSEDLRRLVSARDEGGDRDTDLVAASATS